MAGSTIKQVIPVDLVASIRNSADISKKLRDELEDSLSSIDASSSLGKNLTKMLSDTTKKIVQLQAIAGKSFFSDKDLRSSLTLLDGITTKMSQIRTVVGGASASALGLDTAEIRAARNEIQRLQGEVKARRNQAVGTTSVSQDAALVKRLEATRGETGYDSGRSFSANIANFQSAIGRLNGEIVNLASTVTGSAEKVKSSQRELQTAQADLGEQQTQYQQARAAYGDFSAASLLKEFGYKSYSGKKAKQQAAQRSSDLIQGLVKDGEFVEGGAEISEALGRWLKIDPAQLQGPAQDIVNNIVAAMQAAINNPESLKALKKNITDQQVGTKDGAAITSQYQTAKNQFEQAKTNVADATTNLQASQQQMQTDSTNLQNTKALLQEINDLLNILLAKRQEFDKDLGETYNAKLTAARSQLKQAVEQAKQPQSQEIGRLVEQQSRQQEGVQRQADAHAAANQAARDIEEQNKRMQAEQQQFSSQLNQSISRWMSVGQIIQYVKTGIREAWQDVQNLDKAMTNIAVVTDMSIGDLWGKINEYMSIAKEYGVTTQGVYEVSQLFFQQGLSANDVMAATTETLKMARIAGISYKDAADGMTVAIRAFRMEMEQASHVTDVYSKVAAVTASDTEELITAMSKTASSAEAVGSSFENTTAMLAVMIEATRESATNIGSAMKSIISRYGEMKEGMSADTEGEGIAYNKVDKALQSIGMTLKDNNGQFRDFDDVIEELASKWDTLDSLQQRYIATIFAGNRQQSRFLALVSNYDRYMEVSAAAADAEDAGLLQYSKTLDSLETKLNNLSTSFQQFYMSIANGAIFGGAIEGITKFVEGLNKLGNFSAIINIVGILRSLKLVTKTAVNAFTTMTSQIRSNVETVFTQIASSMVAKMRQAGSDSALAIQQGAQQGAQGPNPNSPGKAVISPKIGKAINVASLVGAGLSIAGAGVAADNAFAGSLMTTAGSALSFGAQGAMIGSAIAPGVGTAIGAAIGVLAGALSQIPALINAHANQAQEALDKATKEAEEKNIERAQAAEDYRSLESTIENLKKLQAARYDSEEAEKAFADAQKEAAEKFPELISGYTATGEAIVDVVNDSVNAELILADARKKAADATLEAAAADLNKANKEAVVKSQAYEPYKEARRQFLANFNQSTADTVTLPKYENLDEKLKHDLYYSENIRLLYEQIKDFEGYQQKLNNYRERYKNDNKSEQELQYMAVIDQFNEEYDAAYADLLTVNATQSQKQRIEISAALSQSLASDLNPDLWTKSGAISSLVSNAFTSKYFDENGFFDKENFKYDEYFDSEGKIIAKKINEDIKTFFTTYEGFFSKLQTEEEIAGFEQLIADVDKGQYSANQLASVLGDKGITGAQAELYDAFFTPINNAIERTKNKIEASDFSSAFGNEEALDAFLQTLPTVILNNISSFITDLQNKIDNEQINETQAKGILNSYKDFINSIFSPNSGLNYSQQMTAANIISQGDMTTLFGQYQIQQQLNDALGEFAPKLVFEKDGEWVSKVGTSVENVVLSYQAFAEDLSASVNSISEVFKNASSGFDLEDAQKIADKVGEDINSLFNFNEGKWFIDPNSFEKIYGVYEDANAEQKELLKQQQEKALDGIKQYIADKSNTEAKRYYDTYLEGAESYYKQKTGKDKLPTDFDEQYAIFEEYLNFIGEKAIDAADQQLEWLKKDLAYNIDVANATNRVKDIAYGSKGYNWSEAINILSQKGGPTGFSPEEAGKLVAQRIFTESQFFADGTGNLRVTEQAYREALSQGGRYLVDQYDISLAEKARQLGDSVLTLGKSATAGTAYDSDWRKLAQDLGIQDINERGIQQLKNFFSSDKYSNAWAEIYASVSGLPLEEIKALWQKYQTGTALGAQDLQKQILENYAKVLKGELTSDDIAAMDGKIGAAVANFANMTGSQITAYIQALLEDASSSFSDKVSSLSSVYKDQLDKDYPVFSSPEQIVKNTRMNSSQAAQLLAELNMLYRTEKYAIGDLFAYNKNDQTFSLMAGKGAEVMSALETFKSTTDEQTSAIIDSYIALFQSLSSEAFFTNAQSAAETVKKYATSTEMTFKDIQSIYSEFGRNLPAAEAAAEAARLNKLDPWERIQELIGIYSDFGVTLDGSKYNEIVNTVFDSIISIIKNAVTKLSSGLSGTLSFSDFQTLIDQGFINASQGRVGYQGVRLTNEGRQQYLTKLYQQAAQLGGTQGLGEEIWSTLSSSQNKIFDGYVEIEDEIKRVQSELDALGGKPSTNGLEDYLALLNQVRAAAMFDPNAAEFDFMGQEGTNGLTKNFDKFMSSIDSVKTAFGTLSSGKAIGYDSFYNMVDFLGKFASDGKLAAALKKKGITLNDFANAAVESSKKIGKVDLKSISAQLGISMSQASKIMKDDMLASLKEVANQQVKYLTGLENMLKAMAAIDGLDANAEVALTYTVDGKEEGQITFDNIWKQYSELSDEKKKIVEVEFEAKYGFKLTELSAAIVEQMNSPEFRGAMDKLSEDDALNFGNTIAKLLDPSQSPLYENGELVSDWQAQLKQFFEDVISGVGLESFSAVVAGKLAKMFEAGFTSVQLSNQTLQLVYEGSNIKVSVGELKEGQLEDIQSQINEQLAANGLMIKTSTPTESGYTFSITPIVDSSSQQSLISQEAADKAKSELDEIKQKLEDIGNTNPNPTVSITISGLLQLITAVSLLKSLKSGSGVEITSGGGDTTSAFTGTINSIGPAFADGSLGRLRAGAAMTQKTLVGELGPELAVYDGQYHLLGKNGAEFVNLPDDAIIFNHLQTQGILRGQMNVRGTAVASGTVNSGPAMANGNIGAALQAVQRAKAVWQGLLTNLTAKDLLGAGGGGGGGGDKKAVIQDLQEWYNLSRQIANIEQEINNIVAERENLADGSAYLRSLRQQQELLQDQASIQKILLDYQDKQLQRQADLINQDRIWSKFLTVGEGGLLQYTVGNETNGGKGALQVLDELNKMSAQAQIDYLKSIGYTYTDTDGKELKDTELVTKFFEELQKQIDEYDALYDTVHETKQTVEKLKSDIEKINQEIVQNQMDLEKAIYDIIVDAWQNQIDQLDKQAKLTKEVNDNYINGLNDALKLEQERYQQNQKIADREALQRQLSLLRRSGGSASEIADLEKQLDEKLKDEYFDNQQKAIEKIQEANEKQVQQLEQQVQLQKEALDYQKENGIIWTKVYDVMAGQKDEILQFMQGNAVDFFSKSTLEQEKMLTEWAKKIGIYSEDKLYQEYSKLAQDKYWTTGAVWKQGNLASLKGLFDSLTDAERKEIQDAYITTFSEAMLRGATEDEAVGQAAKEMAAQLSNKQKAAVQTPVVSANGAVGNASANSGAQQEHKVKDYTHWTFTFNGKKYAHYASKKAANDKIISLMDALNEQEKQKYNEGSIDAIEYANRRAKNYNLANAAVRTLASGKHSKGYSLGGLVDYTGPAIVHGTPARPEAFLNAEQTKQIREGLELTSDIGPLASIRGLVGELSSFVRSLITNNSTSNEINISKGAIQITVGNLNDKYDIEDVSNDIMNRIVSIASKATNRGVNRR